MSIHTDIPYYPSFATPGHPGGVHCIEMSLKMILGALEPDKQYSIEELEAITAKQPEKASWEMPFFLWFVNRGYQAQHWSMFDFATFAKEGAAYVRRVYGDDVADYQERESDIPGAMEMAPEFVEKVDIIAQRPTIEVMERLLSDGWLLKPCVNSNLLNERPGYTGHSVVIIGFEGDEVIFHDPGLPAYEARREPKQMFQEAMDSFGGQLDAFKDGG